MDGIKRCPPDGPAEGGSSGLLLKVEAISTPQTRIEAATKDGGIARGMGN